MMIGSVEEVIQSHNKREDLRLSDDVIDDFDIGDGDHELIKVHLKEENLEKVKRRVEQCKIKMIGEPRENKKLLVLDIDYTLFDHRSTAERPEELRRPYLLEFLTEVYNHYDIVIWSATSMKWIEVKMKELGVTGENSTNLESNGFKILAFMDYTAMISVSTEKYGTIDCKPLGVLWQSELMQGKYGPENTIMFDDLRRNFVMNPRSGLKIRPFKQAHINRQTDKELVKLSKYLRFIRHAKDLSKLDHRRWESWMRKLKERAKSTNRHHSHSSAPQP
jgi:ubiquitin-like domain-containing CTD phosphatase 1